MLASGNTSSHPLFFILLGIPGLENYHFWIAFPLCAMYLVAIVGNIIVLHIVRTDHTLHEPMYLFLAMLAITDLTLSSSTQPKMLAILWFHAHEIEYHACLIQVFFIHAFSSVSGMPFCPNHVIPQSYCEHMAVLKLVCADTRVNRAYGLSGAFFVVGFDIIVISLSYVMILRTVLRLPSDEARLKAFGTCASHICVILAFYIPALFTFLTHRFGRHVPRVVHIMFATLYLLVPPMLNPIIYGVRTKQIWDRVI
ncbi:hypothetical protein PANDA_022281, partial [Ailuropoda melanoleuca]